MQNKTNTLRTNLSLPSQRYYRSVKYKVDPSISQHKDKDHISPYTSTRTMSSWKKPHAQLSSTVYNTRHLNNPEDDVQLKRPYMQTWTRMLHSNQLLEEAPKGQRVHLPHIIDHDPSMFTALDPLFLPITHIQQGISELRSALPAPKTEMAQIRSDLKKIEQKVSDKLANIEDTAKEGFSKLRKMLRQDQVQLQENMMRFKRNLQLLKQEDIGIRQNFEQTKPRVLILQDEIFSTRPFELERQEGLSLEFPQVYF